MSLMLPNDRIVISALESEFSNLHSRYCALVCSIPEGDIYRNPGRPAGPPVYSAGEILLRGAALVEQTCGGITANLWDDPFEWTLPETLSTSAKIIEYLEEVEATRRRAFSSFNQDQDLLKEIMAPTAETRVLIDLLTETLVKSAEYYGRAMATRSLLLADASAGE